MNSFVLRIQWLYSSNIKSLFEDTVYPYTVVGIISGEKVHFLNFSMHTQ